MNESDKKQLQGILKKINALKKDVEKLLKSESTKPSQKTEESEEVKELIESIDGLSATDLETKLNTFSHKELGEAFIGVGGSSGDKRKPKAWLIDRILWLTKEFSKGHKSIRES